MANGGSSWLWAAGGTIAGTVLGGLILRGLGLGAIDARLKAVEERLTDIADRLERLESLAMNARKDV